MTVPLDAALVMRASPLHFKPLLNAAAKNGFTRRRQVLRAWRDA
jgi:hypothetical protein